ncbi:hypothetical protein MHYP_G00332950 [Metynnis hypsauchen]
MSTGGKKYRERKASGAERGKFHLLSLEHSFVWEEEEREKRAVSVELLSGVGELRMAPSAAGDTKTTQAIHTIFHLHHFLTL